MRGRPQSPALPGCALEASPDDRLVPEEYVLHAGLPMVARPFLPPTSSDRPHLLDRAIASSRPRSAPRHRERFGRRHHDGRATRTSGIVDGDRVVGPVRCDAGGVAVDRIDQMESSGRVIAWPSVRASAMMTLIGRPPDGASSSRAYRVRHVSPRPTRLRPRSTVPSCRR
jgi:hypothetical protein